MGLFILGIGNQKLYSFPFSSQGIIGNFPYSKRDLIKVKVPKEGWVTHFIGEGKGSLNFLNWKD